MTEPIWNQFLTARDKAVFATSGYGARQGFGKGAALLIIDVNYAFCGDKPEPILESMKKWRNYCGEYSWVALSFIRALIDKAREKGLPVIYTSGVRRGDLWDSGSWAWKNNRSAEDAANKTVISNLDGNQIMAEIAPSPRDIGFCLLITISGGLGAISAMIWLPSRLEITVLLAASSAERLFFQAQLPESHRSPRRTPLV